MNSKLKTNSIENEQETKEAYIQALRFRKILEEMLQREITSQYNSMGVEEDFNSPSWSLVQAHKMGQVKALKKILSFL